MTYPDYTGKHILIAEDEILNYNVLKNFLVKTNAVIYWAKNGVEAVDITIKNQIDLVLMDIRMPEMDGIAATKLIKKYYPEMPVIAQTAFTMQEDIEKMMKADINEYIAKPIDGELLLYTLNKYLKKQA